MTFSFVEQHKDVWPVAVRCWHPSKYPFIDRITRSSMLLVRWPPGCEYAEAYSADRPHSLSTCSRSHADIPRLRAHSRSRRSRCAKPRREGA